MASAKHLGEFVRQCNLAASEDQLYGLLDETTRQLGFEQFAMTRKPAAAHRAEASIAMASYHPEWIRTLNARKYFLDDPIEAASARAVAGFLWCDIGTLIDLSERQKEILEAASRFGLREGFTVPVHLPGEYRGSCSFGALSLDKVGRDSLVHAEVVGTFAFEAARRLNARRQAGAYEKPRLTERQLDCLTLVAMGKTDWEIGRILGIAEGTAHDHIEAARRRYGVGRRTQLVIRALFDGQISFADVLH